MSEESVSLYVCVLIVRTVCVCRQTTDGDWPWRWLQKGSYHPSGGSTGLPIHSDNIYPTTDTDQTRTHTQTHTRTPEGQCQHDRHFFVDCCVCILWILDIFNNICRVWQPCWIFVYWTWTCKQEIINSVKACLSGQSVLLWTFCCPPILSALVCKCVCSSRRPDLH